MKKATLVLAITTFVLFGCKSGEKHDKVFDGPIETISPKPDGHTSKNSLDWAGVYEETTPCADCDGILTRVELGAALAYNNAACGHKLATKAFHAQALGIRITVVAARATALFMSHCLLLLNNPCG